MGTVTRRPFSLQKGKNETGDLLQLGHNAGAPKAGDLTAGLLGPITHKIKANFSFGILSCEAFDQRPEHVVSVFR